MILRAAWVVPVSAAPIRDGLVEIDGSRIVGVGRARRRGPAGEQLGQVALLPGLVNPHTHLELGCYAGRLAPGSFWVWLEGLVRLRRRGRIEQERQAAVAGAWESLRAGVTCVGDISRAGAGWRALKTVPIRKVCFVELIHQAELFPRDAAGLAAAAAEVQEDDLLTVGFSPHAPYTVPAEQFRAAVELAEQRQRPWTTHWAETREEVAFLEGRTERWPEFLELVARQCGVESPCASPLEYLARCCAGRRPGVLAHVNYLTDRDLGRLAAAGHTVAYCPRAHRFFGHPPHPLPRLRRAGVPVVLGTDSLASNQSLALLEEARCVRAQVAEAPSAEALLRMMTLEAARALGLERCIGSLEAGKQADLAAFACPSSADPLEALIAAAPPAAAVWVAGRRVI